MATTRAIPSSHFFPPIITNLKCKNLPCFRFNFHHQKLGKWPSPFLPSISSSFRCSSHCPESSDSTSKPEVFILTTPLYYVNAPPHMGSAYTTIAGDAIARFQRLMGKKVIFVTGTDEHGEKIATAASANGRSPKEHCDIISHSYRMLWKELDIAFDKFIRTTDSSHETIVKEFYSKVLDKGDIYRARYEGLYCVNCEEYKDEKDLIEDHCCPIHLKPCVPRKEDNYFFALSKYRKLLEEYLERNQQFVQPSYRLNEDILRFHAVYWPAMLMSAGFSPPKIVFGHGFLTKVDIARVHFESLALSNACASVLEIGNAGNLYIDEHAPWSKFKAGDASAEAAAKDLVIILEAVRIIAVALSPITPSLCLRIYSQLGYSKEEFDAITWNDTTWGGLREGQIMKEPAPIFARIEIEDKKEGNDGHSPKKASKLKSLLKTQEAAQAQA
ncbi:unnamed protein product [Victoria cruziana]